MSLHLDMFAEISLRKIVTNIKGLELYEDIEANEALGKEDGVWRTGGTLVLTQVTCGHFAGMNHCGGFRAYISSTHKIIQSYYIANHACLM